MVRACRVLVVVVLAALGLPESAAAGVAHANVVSNDPADWTPHVVDGDVRAIAEVGDRIVVGGSFTEVEDASRAESFPRRGLFAFDRHTGAIDLGFVPDVDGVVEALTAGPDGRSVLVGGRFTHGGTPRQLVKLDGVTGSPSPDFDAQIAGASVQDLVVRGRRLFVGGAFSAVGGVARSGLAAVDVVTGAVDPAVDVPFTEARQGSARIEKLDVSDDGSRLVAVGNFTRVAGQERHQVAVVDVSTVPATLADWHTDRYEARCSDAFDTYMRDVDIAPGGTYFVAVTTGARTRPTLCDSAARWELGSRGAGLQPTWVDYSGGDSLTAVAVTGAAVYVGGHQRWMNNPFPQGTGGGARPGPGAIPRSGIAALDPASGLPFAWNPGRDPRGAGVFALVATPAGLWVGSDTADLGGEYHGRLALCPLAGGAAVATPSTGTLPGYLYSLGLGGDLLRRTFDGRQPGQPGVVATAVDWSRARGAFMVSGWLYTGWDDGRLDRRSFDGATFGPPAEVDLHGLAHRNFPVADLTGMFFADGRLYYRYFTPEGPVVGAEELVASGDDDGLDWGAVRGLTLASGRIYYAGPDGVLYAMDFTGGRPVAGTETVVAGPAASGTGTWASEGMFVWSG